MARSLKDKLAEVKRLEDKAAEMARKAEQERERIIAPTRAKIADLFNERLDAFLKTNIENLADLRIDRAALAKAFDGVLTGQITRDAFADAVAKDIASETK